MLKHCIVGIVMLGTAAPAAAQLENILGTPKTYNGLLPIGDDANHMCPSDRLVSVTLNGLRPGQTFQFTILDQGGHPVVPGVPTVGRGFRLTEKPSQQVVYVLRCGP